MEYELCGKNLIVHLPEELDHHNSQTLKRDVELLLAEYEIRRIVFDFSMVTFMDSSGIGAILGRYKRMQDVQGDVALYGACGRTEKLLQMAGIGKLAVVCEKKEQALKKWEERAE